MPLSDVYLKVIIAAETSRWFWSGFSRVHSITTVFVLTCFSLPPTLHTTQLSAQVLTLQEGGEAQAGVSCLDISGSGNLEDKSNEQLWEIIR